jgi:hypothetical protein
MATTLEMELHVVTWYDQYPGQAHRRLARVSARGALVAALTAATLAAGCAAGCAAEHPAPPPPRPSSEPTAIPPYDASLPPARAVQALVPLRARTLRLVDLAEIRRQVGLPELTSRSSAEDRAEFWSRAAVAAPLLDPAVLVPIDDRLRTGYGFGVDDVAWEAHFSDGITPGWVVAFGPGVDMKAVTRAAQAGVGPLRDAHVDAADRLVTYDAAASGEPVWGSDPTWARLVPGPGEAFLVHRGCLEATGQGPTREPISGFAVTFGDHVATVRVDRDRTDLFARARLGRGRFARVFRQPVADPSSGRIGYDIPEPARAAALVRDDVLPFGVCAPGD